jgi:hypothetical protein
MRRSRRFLAALALASSLTAGVVLTAAPPAGAATAAAALLTSSGTITPGLDLTGVHPDTFTWTAAQITTTGVIQGRVSVLGTSGCYGLGGSIGAETIAGGVGTGSYSCTTGVLATPAPIGGTLVYLRVGNVVLYEFGGDLVGSLACIWQFDQLPPATLTSWRQTCAGALASTT